MDHETLTGLLLAASLMYLYTGLFLYRKRILPYLNEPASWSPRVQRRQVLRYFEAHRGINRPHLVYFRNQRYVGLLILLMAGYWWQTLPIIH